MGNLATTTTGSDVTTTTDSDVTTYTYDALDRLITAQVPGSSAAAYTYDPTGQRVRQTVGSDTTNYLWDELSAYGDVVRETNGTGTELASYTLAETQLLGQTRSGVTSYYLSDGQGSTRALLNGTGDITDTYDYTAFGEMVNQTGSTLNNYRYTGQQFDSLTGLYSLRARYYDPNVGRFVSRDTYPISYRNPIELNRYGYAANNPIDRYDPTGRFMEYAFLHADKEVVGGTIGGATGGFAFSTFLYVLGMLNPFIGWCGGRGTSKLQEWAWLLTAHNQVFDFIVGATVQGAVYGAIGGVIAAIDPYIGLLMLTMGVAEAIHWLFSTYTEPGDQICATVAGAGAAIVGIATSWTFTTGWDNWSNGRGKPGLGGEGPDGRPNNTGGGPELGGGPNDGSGGPYDPPSGGTPGDEGNPEWPTGGGLDDSDQHPTNGGLDDTEQHPTGGGDDDGRPGLGGVGNHFCSFSEDTPVATEDGQTLIGDLELGDKVLAYNEETGELEYQEVTAVWEHYDDVLLLTIDDETLETTTDHPFYTDQGEWVAAGDLEVGMHVRKSDGTYGEVEAIEQTETTQPMFNLTVDEVHTYFVGDEQWLVHNFCSRQVPYNDTGLSGDARLFRRTSPDGYRQRDVAVYVYDETQVKIFMSDPTAQTYGKGHAEQLGKQWFEKNLIDPSRIDALYTELEPCKNCQSVLTGWLPDDFEVTYSFKHPGEKAAWERAIAENWGNR